jgi:hypothetical protein
MSNIGFNLAKVGLAGNSGLGRIEAARRQQQAQMNAEEQLAQGQATGTLVGALARGGVGVYDERKRGFDKEHDSEQRAFDQGDDAYKATHARPEYSALDDLAGMFEGWFA